MDESPRTTTVRLSVHLAENLDEACERLGIPLNSLIAIACNEWLENHGRGAQGEEADRPGLARRLWGSGMFKFSGFTPEARELLVAAQENARQSGSRYIKPRDLVQAALDAPSSEAGRALVRLGVAAEAGRDGAPGSVKKVMQLTVKEARMRGEKMAGTGDILVGLAAAGVLADITAEQVRGALT
ncbi:MAG TPA: hypothetical protein VF137_12040 [Candidatus Dormibacteraeota bacterium]